MGGQVIEGKEDDVLNVCKEYVQDVWWLIVINDGGRLAYRYVVSCARSRIPELVNLVKELLNKGIPHIVFAVWHGKWRTDIFVVPSEKIIEVLGHGAGS